MTRATEAHLQYAKGVLRYLKGVMDRRITWCAENARDPHQRHEIWASADSSFADTKPLRKSTFCYQLFVNNAVFSWKAGLSSIVATSTCEAELMAFVSCACEVVYARKLAGELGFPQLTPTKIYEDNQGALVLVDKMHLRNRSKHIGLRFCFVQRLKELGIISGEYNPSADQHSNIGTKFVSENAFEHHISSAKCCRQRRLKSSTGVCLVGFSARPWYFGSILGTCIVTLAPLLQSGGGGNSKDEGSGIVTDRGGVPNANAG